MRVASEGEVEDTFGFITRNRTLTKDINFL